MLVALGIGIDPCANGDGSGILPRAIGNGREICLFNPFADQSLLATGVSTWIDFRLAALPWVGARAIDAR